MPDKGNILTIITDERCLLVLKSLIGPASKRRKWVNYSYIKDQLLSKKEDTSRVYESLEGASEKVPKATAEDYFVETGKIPSESLLNRTIQKLIHMNLIERRKRKRLYEHRITEKGAGLYLRADTTDRILSCQDSNMFIWSDEIMSFSSAPIQLLEGDWNSIPDLDKDVKGKLEEAIENFRIVLSMGRSLSQERHENKQLGTREDRIIIVLDFNRAIE
jgi:hypothetical protein